ncbi:MAG: hypothetical protein HGA45_15925, partial [Chloroflexales bacterium]|nr:hypothetical protein [Chloroflexales bacterium]
MSETRDATPARVNYFYGQFLQEEDFLAEQAYHIGQQRRLAQILRRPGIIRGLQVEVLDKDTGQVRVNPGLAVDGLGQLIVLNPSKGLDLRDADGIHVLTISFGLEGTSQTTTGNEGYSRMREQPSIAWYPDGQAPPNDTHPRLGRLRLSAGKIVALDNSDPNALIDTSVRTAAAMSVEGNLDVVGNSGLGGTLTVESGTALNSTLSVKARATLQNGLTISGAQAEVQNGLVVRNPSGLALTVSQGATQLQGGLRVSLGATQLQGGLTVSGAQAEVQNGLVVRNPSGPALTVSQGATQLQGGLVVRSGSDAAGSVGLSVTQGATQLQGGLTANGGSTLTGG